MLNVSKLLEIMFVTVSFWLIFFFFRFFFDFSTMYIGVGMICPYLINISLLLGTFLSWGILWPIIETKEGDWYESGLEPGNFHGIQGYRVRN